MRAAAVGGADGATALRRGREPPAVVAAVDGVFRGGVRGRMVIERARRRGDQLQRGAHFCLGSAREKILAAFVARRGRTGAGFWIDGLLFIAGGL